MTKTRVVLLFLILFSAFSVAANSQGLKRRMADKYFEQLDFYKAAPIFDELAAKSIKDSEKKGTDVDWNLIRLAAQSNYHARNYKKADEWYKKLDKSGTMTEEEYLSFIDILHYNGEYDEADAIVDRLYGEHPSNHRISLFYHNKETRYELMLDSNQFTIKEAPFNKHLGDFGPAFYEGGVVFASSRKASGFINRKYLYNNSHYLDIYYSKKDKNNKYQKKSKILGGVFKTGPHDGPVFFNKANDMAVITRNFTVRSEKGDQVHLKLEIIKKDEDGKWGDPIPFPYNNKNYSVGHATLSEDGKTMYFASNMPGGHGGSDLWMTTLVDSNWTKPVNLGDNINTSHDEEFPFLYEDKKLYFASDGHFGLGGLDIFVSDVSSGIPTDPANMEYPLNSQFDDFALIVDSTGGAGFFSSARGDGIDRIYSAKWELPEFDLDGIVVLDDGKKTPLGDIDVVITNLETGHVDTVKADQDGEFNYLLHRNTDYKIIAFKDKFDLVSEQTISTKGRNKSETLNTELTLHQQWVKLRTTVHDKETKLPLANAKVTLIDKTTNQVMNLTTDDEGVVIQDVEMDHEFEITGHVHGYLDHTVTSNTLDKQGIVDVDVELALEKIKVGGKFVVENIYYDYNKWFLRPESKVELDKLAIFLIDNDVKVELSAHTDSRGTARDNIKLSQRRAQSCVNYLIEKGVKKENIIAKGYGESQLVNGCKDGVECSDDEHQQNRRTEIKILKVN